MENFEAFDEFEIVTLEMEDGSAVEFAIVDEFTKDDQKYVVLIETEGDMLLDDGEHGLIMKDNTDASCKDEECILDVIDSEEEYIAVCDFYEELCAGEVPEA